MLQGNLHLTMLNLSYNKLGDAAGVIIGPAIGQCLIVLIVNISHSYVCQNKIAKPPLIKLFKLIGNLLVH